MCRVPPDIAQAETLHTRLNLEHHPTFSHSLSVYVFSLRSLPSPPGFVASVAARESAALIGGVLVSSGRWGEPADLSLFGDFWPVVAGTKREMDLRGAEPK